MVFPSLGCQTCKKRRVKCDSAHPNCNRCEKANRMCVWDSDEATSIPFRSENTFAQGKPRRPRKAPLVPRRALVRDSGIATLSMPLSVPIEVYAFNYWKETFTAWPEDLFDVSLEYGAHALCDWNHAQPDSSLHLAVSAFSLAIFGRVKFLNNAVRDAHRYYSRSCVSIRKEIQELSNENIDQVLTATMLLATYDNMIPKEQRQSLTAATTLNTEKRGWDVSHHRGTAALILARAQQRYHQNLSLDMALRRPIIRKCILHGAPVPLWLQYGSSQGEVNPDLQLDSLMIRVASLRSRFVAFILGSGGFNLTRSNEFENLLLEANNLDFSLAEWSSGLPEDWAFDSILHTSQGNEISPFLYDGLWGSYMTHGHAVVWNRYRTIRLIVNSIRVRLLSSIAGIQNSHVDEQLETSRHTINSLTTDMCRSVGFFLVPFYPSNWNCDARFDEVVYSKIRLSNPGTLPKMATVLAWPLAVANSIEAVPLPQKQWLQYTLQEISGIIGAAVVEALDQSVDFHF